MSRSRLPLAATLARAILTRTPLIGALLAGALCAAAPAAAVDLTIEVDHARTIRLPESASAVIVGNPLIADVTPHDDTLFLITGKSFGSTNIIALDQDGRQIYSADVRVVSSSDGRLTMHRGLARESYHCVANCERIPVPGDNTATFNATMSSRLKAIDAAISGSQ